MIIFHDYYEEESSTSDHLDDIAKNGTGTNEERLKLVYITVNVAHCKHTVIVLE